MHDITQLWGMCIIGRERERERPYHSIPVQRVELISRCLHIQVDDVLSLSTSIFKSPAPLVASEIEIKNYWFQIGGACLQVIAWSCSAVRTCRTTVNSSRTSVVYTCVVPRTQSQIGDRSFSVAGPRLWIPTEIRERDITYQHCCIVFDSLCDKRT